MTSRYAIGIVLMCSGLFAILGSSIGYALGISGKIIYRVLPQM